MRLRLRALVPALALGGALVAPPVAEADGHRRADRGRRYGYERSDRSDHRGRHHRSYRPGHHRGHHRPHYRRYHHGPRHYYRPHHRRVYRPYWDPRPPYRPHYYAPRGFPYAHPGPVYGPPPYRGGVHGSVSIGLPFVGFSLHF